MRLAAVLVTAPLVLAATATAALGDVADDCVAAAEQAQPLRKDGKLRAAREKLVVCTKAECPAAVRGDCTKWMTELDAVMPSVIFVATDSSGADVADVQVSVDGTVVATGLDGKEMPIDPGPHTFRFEHAGAPAVEQRSIIRETERHRPITVKFATPAPVSSSPTETPGGSAAGTGTRVLPFVLLGVGAASLAVASYFWLSGLNEHSTLASTCALSHACSENDINAARNRLVVGDVLGGAGIVVAAIGAGLLIWGRPAAQAAAPPVGVQPVPGGAMIDVAARF